MFNSLIPAFESFSNVILAAKDDEDGRFADPGYQPDGKKRYKLNTEKQVRAAWSYIHMPKNRKFYTKEQLKHIEDAIIKAWKEMIDPEGPPESMGSDNKE